MASATDFMDFFQGSSRSAVSYKYSRKVLRSFDIILPNFANSRILSVCNRIVSHVISCWSCLLRRGFDDLFISFNVFSVHIIACVLE